MFRGDNCNPALAASQRLTQSRAGFRWRVLLEQSGCFGPACRIHCLCQFGPRVVYLISTIDSHKQAKRRINPETGAKASGKTLEEIAAEGENRR